MAKLTQVLYFPEWIYRWIVMLGISTLIALLSGIYTNLGDVKKEWAVHVATDEIKHKNVVYRIEVLERKHNNNNDYPPDTAAKKMHNTMDLRRRIRPESYI